MNCREKQFILLTPRRGVNTTEGGRQTGMLGCFEGRGGVLTLDILVLHKQFFERVYQLYIIYKILGESMTINSVMRCVVMFCLTGG